MLVPVHHSPPRSQGEPLVLLAVDLLLASVRQIKKHGRRATPLEGQPPDVQRELRFLQGGSVYHELAGLETEALRDFTPADLVDHLLDQPAAFPTPSKGPDMPAMTKEPEAPEAPATDTPTTRTCKGCGQEKPLEQFFPNVKARDGRLSTCSACMAEKRRQGQRRPAGQPAPTSKPKAAPKTETLPAQSAPARVALVPPADLMGRIEQLVEEEVDRYRQQLWAQIRAEDGHA